MANARSSHLLHQVGRLFGAGVAVGLTDAQLLSRFTARSAASAEARSDAEAAFEVLVARHGPMVLGVCRRALTDPTEIEDAFQATFLVLVRRANSVRVDDSLGRWLYGVARRVAAKARARSRRDRARDVDLVVEPEASTPVLHESKLLTALDEEVHRLPEKYRGPVVLCHLEGLTHAEAADRLRWPVGTVSGRLSRARELLRDRLVRRGHTPTSEALGILLSPGAFRTSVPECLAMTTVRAAVQVATTGKAEVAIASASAVSLMNEVLRSAVAFKLKATAAVLLVIAATAVAIPVVVAGAGSRGDDADPAASRRAELGNEDDRPPHYRPADEIVKELRDKLAMARRPLPHEVFRQIHAEIAALVLELRTAYPADARGARHLLDRWAALSYIDRRPEAIDESCAVLTTTKDPVLKQDALFYQTVMRFRDPMDGPTAASLARDYIREAAGDKRAAGVLYQAAEKLQSTGYTRLGLATALVMLGGLMFMKRRWWTLLFRLGLAVLALIAVVLGGVRLFSDDGLSRLVSASFEMTSEPTFRNRVLGIGFWLSNFVFPDLQSVVLSLELFPCWYSTVSGMR